MADQSTDHILERELNDVQQKEKPARLINEVAVKRGLSLTFQLAARGRNFITTKIENIYNAVTDLEQHKQAHNIRILLKELSIYKTEDQINTPVAENHIKNSFKKFLGSLGYEFALKNFDALLEEKSGDKAKRSDGTVAWYHEFSPIVCFLFMGEKGMRNWGFNLRDLKKEGGLEVALITHLRHDSAEDFIGPKAFEQQLRTMGNDLVKAEGPYTKDVIDTMIDKIRDNVDLMTRKRVYNPDGSPLRNEKGKHVKEEIDIYMGNLATNKKANPVVFIFKQLDKLFNLLTAYDAEKYPPARVVELGNEVENMFGSRRTYVGYAIKTWKTFSNAISTVDHAMATVLFPLFRRLENVDRVYHHQDWGRVGIDTQLKKAIVFCKGLPEAFNPLHADLRRIMKSVDPVKEPEKYGYLQKHLEEVIKPVYKPHQVHFPYFFGIDTSSPIQKIGAKLGLVIE